MHKSMEKLKQNTTQNAYMEHYVENG